ncbi:hypothetical protein BJ878DRAFT_538915 [Calycina marina]|uniref:Integral membrane protein n=1 Tax=Calycina marina TaxID=1763456 RepID=A0A9P7ZAE4_9HELO|nr:hypothetical protein BJ878DRAFT_538915 [Calycina marina]
MAAKWVLPVLVTLMLVSGVCNTLLTKYQDNICVRDCDAPNPADFKHFEQPVIQTMQMFMGESGCWLIVGLISLYKRFISKSSKSSGYSSVNTYEADDETSDTASINSRTQLDPLSASLELIKDDRILMSGWKVCMLAMPAICDICGTTLMNVGLLFVVPSIYQMTRGALVLFVGIFSVVFLKRRLLMYQWLALVTVVLGVGIVGVAGAIYKDHKAIPTAIFMLREAVAMAEKEARSPEAIRTIIGILLIASAQVFTASQFVIEEFILEKYALPPIEVVGWEGLFGFAVTLVGMLVLYLAIGRTEGGRYGYFDLVEGWRQVTQYKEISITSFAIMLSIGGFNFFGISVTRSISATSRSTIDTCRTLFIWIVSLFLGWETFKWLQVLGFLLLVYGTFLFNGLVRPPFKSCIVQEERGDLPEAHVHEIENQP